MNQAAVEEMSAQYQVKATSAPEKLITDHLDLWTSAIVSKNTSGRGTSQKIELYGIKKMRELILELAVRGKLVPQDPDAEPASELLKRVADEKAKLVREKKIAKPKKLPSIVREDITWKAPESWAIVRFGEVFDLEYGDNLPKAKRAESGEFSVYGSNGVVGSHHECSIDSPCIVVGRKGSAGALNLCLDEGCWVTDVAYSLVPPSDISIHYSFKLLHTLGLEELGKGIKPGLNRNEAYMLPLALPPLEEQHRIVAKVDELMALCDQLENQTEQSMETHATLTSTLLDALTQAQSAEELAENWQRLEQNWDLLFPTSIAGERAIEKLKQTILQLAVMGNLVPQDPNAEPASELLQRISAEKEQLIKDKKIKKQKPLPPITEEEKPFELPDGWAWCRLPELGDLSRGKSKHRPRNDPVLYRSGTIPLVQTGDVARADGVISTYTELYNERGVAQSQLWPAGTMCITIAANIADTGILGFDACFPDSVVGFTPLENRIDVRYFDYFIQTAKNHLEEFAPSTAQKNINLEILGQLLVPCPPLAEIDRIVDRVEGLLTLCNALKKRLQTAQKTQEYFTDALVSSALTENADVSHAQ